MLPVCHLIVNSVERDNSAQSGVSSLRLSSTLHKQPSQGPQTAYLTILTLMLLIGLGPSRTVLSLPVGFMSWVDIPVSELS